MCTPPLFTPKVNDSHHRWNMVGLKLFLAFLDVKFFLPKVCRASGTVFNRDTLNLNSFPFRRIPDIHKTPDTTVPSQLQLPSKVPLPTLLFRNPAKKRKLRPPRLMDKPTHISTADGSPPSRD